jgi:hypothetical protein
MNRTNQKKLEKKLGIQRKERKPEFQNDIVVVSSDIPKFPHWYGSLLALISIMMKEILIGKPTVNMQTMKMEIPEIKDLTELPGFSMLVVCSPLD